jgi:hypothetical protein
VFQAIRKSEDEHIALADARYPDYGQDHSAFVQTLDAQARDSIQQVYGLSGEDISFLTLIGLQECE